MKAVTITRAGAPEVLKVKEYPEPKTRPDEVKIQVNAAGVNYADILARKGLYPDAPKLPAVVGYEVAGKVSEVGNNVDQFNAGDRVLAVTRFGGYSDTVVVNTSQAFHIPDNLADAQAAAIPVNYFTAQLLVQMSALQKGETVLIHNAGGGVGLALIDIAGKLGARILGTASAAKHERLKKRGVDETIDYRSENWKKELMQLTDGKGADVIFDPLGGVNWKKSYSALRATGRLGFFGVSDVTASNLFGQLKYLSLLRSMPIFTPVQLMNQNKGVFGVNLAHLWSESDKMRSFIERLIEGVESGWVRPHVDAAFTFDEAAQAHRYIEDRKNFGKVILIPEEV